MIKFEIDMKDPYNQEKRNVDIFVKRGYIQFLYEIALRNNITISDIFNWILLKKLELGFSQEDLKELHNPKKSALAFRANEKIKFKILNGKKALDV